MRNLILIIFIFILITNCGSPATNPDSTELERNNQNFVQIIEFTLDGNKKVSKSDEKLPFSSFGKNSFALAFNDDENDVSFHMIAYLKNLKIGTYQVYNCIGAEDCNEEQRAKNETVLLGFNKTSDYAKVAYNLPSLGLIPLELEIISISNGPLQGLNKTKIIKGHFNCVMAFVMPGPAVVGQRSKIEGKFEVICL